MKYGAYSEKGSYHKRNQDSFIVKKVKGIYIVGISDGLGSKKYSHIGSQLLCKSLLDIVYKVEDFEKISKEKLIELIFQNWLKKIKNLKKYPIEECSATFLFAIILKEKIIVSRVGDGFISIFTDKNSYLLRDNKKDSFSNITMAFSKNFNIDNIEYLEIKNEKFNGLIACTDGIEISPNENNVILRFSKELLEECKNNTKNKLDKETKKWIKEWPSSDDKTLIYLLDDKEEENGEQINRISLKLLNDNNDEVLYEDKKERFNNNYEKTLTKFLSDIYNEKENVKQEKTFEIYKNLNYLMGIHLEKILKNSQLIYGDFAKEKIMIIRNEEIKDIVKCEEILFKSEVNRVILNSNTDKEKEFVPYLRKEQDEAEKVKEIKEELEKNRIVEEKFLETIYNYDYKNFKSLINEYLEKKDVNKYVIVYGYLFFKEINEAKKLIESMIEKKENLNDKKEKIIWDNFILSIIEIMKIMDTENNLNKDESFENIEENLKNKYFEYFKEKTQLYNEIFNISTFEDVNNQMSQLLEKIRKNEMYLKLVTSHIDESKYLEKEFFRFCSLNGLFIFNIESIKRYIEILFISYTNKNIKNQISKNENLLEKFEYFDFFMMLQLNYNDLKKLFNEYVIKDLKCEEEISEKLIMLFKNIFDWIKEDDKKHILQNILLIISRLDLTEIQFKKIIDVILNYRNNSIFFENNSILEIADNFRRMIYKNSKNLSKKFFDKVLKKIFTINKIDETLLNYITYYFEEKEIPKISKNDRIENFINKNNLKIKGYFLRIIDKTYFEELKNEILKEIKETLDIESYSFLLNQKFIDFIPETEDKILEELDEIFQKKDDNKDLNIDNLVNLISKQENILDFLLVSGLNDRLPISFIEKLSNYKNEEFFKSLKQYKLEILWKYILNQENFDFSEFTENELEKFSKIGIKNLLKINDKNLIKTVKEYVWNKIKDDNISEAYFEWEGEKNETTE